jgi:hypothetical protein
LLQNREPVGLSIPQLEHRIGTPKSATERGVGRAPQDRPRVNLTGEPYFTDGLRAVMVISSKPGAEDEIKLLDWDSSSE